MPSPLSVLLVHSPPARLGLERPQGASWLELRPGAVAEPAHLLPEPPRKLALVAAPLRVPGSGWLVTLDWAQV